MSKRIDMNVLAPDAGLVTRFPSNQAGAMGRAIVVASNVRMLAGRLYNTPGYQSVEGLPAGLSSINLVQMLQLQGKNALVLGDDTNLYSVGPDTVYANAGPDAVVEELTYTMEGSGSVPSNTTMTVLWTQIYGPGTTIFSDDSSLTSGITASTAGVYGYMLTVSDGTISASDEVTVTFSPLIPVVLSETLILSVGYAFSYQIQATNNPTSYGGFISLPGDLTFDPTTGIFGGTLPDTLGTYIIPINATNAYGTGSGTLTLVLRNYVVVQPAGLIPTGLVPIFQISVDGAPYSIGTFTKPYPFVAQVKYKMTFPPGSYTLVDADILYEAYFFGFGMVTQAGSTVFLDYAATPPIGGTCSASCTANFSGINSVPSPNTQTVGVVGQNITSSANSNIMLLSGNVSGLLVISNAEFETILNF
jgi:hypothetical protein